jgi:transcriptional antiterminator RfaH
MPILSEETSLFPETLLDDFDIESPRLRWWTAYTMARQEKALARALLLHKIGFYLPLIPKTWVTSQRHKVTSHVPLFSGYVFFRATDSQRATALATHRVSCLLPVDNPGQLVWDLRQFRRLIAAGAPLTRESRLVPGNRVRVTQGVLAGLEGAVVKRRGQTRLLVQMDFIQRGASIEIDDYLLEPID